MSDTTSDHPAPAGPHLAPEVRAFLDGLPANAPPIHTLAPECARQVLRDVQSDPADSPVTTCEDRTIPGGPGGGVHLRIIRPAGEPRVLPAVMFFHGGGWVLGGTDTHDRLVRQLAVALDAAVVFVDYTPSPEARYPNAIEEAYTATAWVAAEGASARLDATDLVVMGDSVGGNMAAAVTMLAARRNGPSIALQVLAYPVTDAGMDTHSYEEFAAGPWLTAAAMRWFWDAYAPDEASRAEPTASPLRAALEDLRGLPPTLILTAENDVLRDEGEAYARRLAEAGVPVTALRYLSTIHDFLLLNPLADTAAARAARDQITTTIRAARAHQPKENP